MPPYRRSYNKSKTVVNRVNASLKSAAFKAAKAASKAALAARWAADRIKDSKAKKFNFKPSNSRRSVGGLKYL